MEVTYYNDHYFEKLLDFYKRIWDPDLNEEKLNHRFRVEYPRNPYFHEGGFPIALLIVDDQIVCHTIGTPCRLWAHNSERPMHWLSGLYLLPEFRGQGYGNLIPISLTKTFPIVSGLAVIAPSVRIHQKLGWTIVGKIPEYIKILKPKLFLLHIDLTKLKNMPRVLKRFAAIYELFKKSFFLSFASGFIDLYYRFLDKKAYKPSGYKNVSLMPVDDFDHRVDALWDKSKRLIRFAQVRSSKYLNWYFASDKGWIKLLLSIDGVIEGYAIISVKSFGDQDQLPGQKVASVIDMLWNFSKPDILAVFIRQIEAYLRQLDVYFMIFSIHHISARKIFIDQGYLPIPSTMHLMINSSLPDVNLSNNKDDWFFTRGDGDAAGSLRPDGSIDA